MVCFDFDVLQEGCDPDGRDSRGITPLGVAVGFNRLPVIKVCLKSKEARASCVLWPCVELSG